MASELIRTKPSAIKKRRGVFYTPSAVSDLLANWAIRSPYDRALEPSFGGCNFLGALQRRFTQLGASEPWEQVFGCDIASAAFNVHLANLLPSRRHRRNFFKADFLTLTPANFGSNLFEAALGNPPYVSYHNMFKVQRVVAARVGSDINFRLLQTGNLWSYFVFHSIRFLAPGGRMAWLLPSSVLQAEYGRLLLDELRLRFRRVGIISLQHKLFDGTDERTEILLCDHLGDKRGCPAIEIANAKSLAACSKLLKDWRKSRNGFSCLRDRAITSLLPRHRLAAFRRIAKSPQTIRLNSLARLSIGVVTGANGLFVISDDIAGQNKIPKLALKPILAKFEIAPGLSVKKSDFVSAKRKGLRCLLVDASVGKISAELKKYFARISTTQRKKNVTFGKRKDWRIPDAGLIPDAFLPYMHHTGPRLILNTCKTNSTNTVHRIYFNQQTTPSQRRLVAISMLSTFSQLSAEVEGRSYGSGVLKHELREAGKIQLLIPDKVSSKRIMKAFKKIDMLLRAGKRIAAQRSADRFLASEVPELRSERSLAELKNDLGYLRRRRHQRKRNETSRVN